MQNAAAGAFSRAGPLADRRLALASVGPHNVPITGGDRRRQCGRCGCGMIDKEVVEQVLAHGDEDAEEVMESQEEEVQPAKTMPTPDMPTEAEVEEHRVDHLPYRSWCRECLEGFGREDAHLTSDHAHEIPIVSLDYMFMSSRGVFERHEWQPAEGEKSLKVLVARDSRSRSVFAHAVPCKGVDEKRFSVDEVVKDIEWLGYSKVIVKSDNEPAINKLVIESLKALRVAGLEQASEEKSVQYDPQTNSGAETGGARGKG